jgi:hypothetical protein
MVRCYLVEGWLNDISPGVLQLAFEKCWVCGPDFNPSTEKKKKKKDTSAHLAKNE